MTTARLSLSRLRVMVTPTITRHREDNGMLLSGKTAIISGAASRRGIGLATARRFAAEVGPSRPMQLISIFRKPQSWLRSYHDHGATLQHGSAAAKRPLNFSAWAHGAAARRAQKKCAASVPQAHARPLGRAEFRSRLRQCVCAPLRREVRALASKASKHRTADCRQSARARSGGSA